VYQRVRKVCWLGLNFNREKYQSKSVVWGEGSFVHLISRRGEGHNRSIQDRKDNQKTH